MGALLQWQQHFFSSTLHTFCRHNTSQRQRIILNTQNLCLLSFALLLIRYLLVYHFWRANQLSFLSQIFLIHHNQYRQIIVKELLDFLKVFSAKKKGSDQMKIYILLIKISILNLLFNLEEIMNEMIDKNSPQRQIKNSSISEKKYLHHFEVINNSTNQSGNKFISTGASSKKYATKLETYSKPQSIIEKIISTEIETQPKGMKVSEDQFVQRPMMIHMNPKVKENVQKTSYFFSMEAQSHHFDHLEQSTLDLPNYLSRILAIPVKKREEKEFVQLQEADRNSHFVFSAPRFSPSPSPPKPPTQSAQQTERQQKLKKIDLLLVQIMREKKRKGLVEDYFQAMEMKLVELLGYILEDQKQYYGLSLTEKMKAVLRNLEDFKGKTIDGQSKINMLRIFFEQFRNLKRQREESTVKHIPQNTQIVQKPKKERKSKLINTHSQKKKAKQNFETMSAGGPRKIDPNSKSIKSYKAEDEWIGSLS